MAHLLTIFVMIIGQAKIVEKANKCYDFVSTTFFYHMIFTGVQYKLPLNVSWWGWHIFFVIITILGSEYICLRIETAEIEISFGNLLEKGKEKGI